MDPWLVAVLLLAVGLAMYGIIEILAIRSAAAWTTAAFIVAIGVTLPIWLLVSTRYTLDQHRLAI